VLTWSLIRPQEATITKFAFVCNQSQGNPYFSFEGAVARPVVAKRRRKDGGEQSQVFREWFPGSSLSSVLPDHNNQCSEKDRHIRQENKAGNQVHFSSSTNALNVSRIQIIPCVSSPQYKLSASRTRWRSSSLTSPKVIRRNSRLAESPSWISKQAKSYNDHVCNKEEPMSWRRKALASTQPSLFTRTAYVICSYGSIQR